MTGHRDRAGALLAVCAVAKKLRTSHVYGEKNNHAQLKKVPQAHMRMHPKPGSQASTSREAVLLPRAVPKDAAASRIYDEQITHVSRTARRKKNLRSQIHTDATHPTLPSSTFLYARVRAAVLCHDKNTTIKGSGGMVLVRATDHQQGTPELPLEPFGGTGSYLIHRI